MSFAEDGKLLRCLVYNNEAGLLSDSLAVVAGVVFNAPPHVVMERAVPSPCWEYPRLGLTAGSVPKEETMTLVGPMTLEESLQIGNNRLSIPVTA